MRRKEGRTSLSLSLSFPYIGKRYSAVLKERLHYERDRRPRSSLSSALANVTGVLRSFLPHCSLVHRRRRRLVLGPRHGERIYRRHVKLPLLLELRSPPRSFFSNVVSASSRGGGGDLPSGTRRHLPDERRTEGTINFPRIRFREKTRIYGQFS